MKDSVPLDDVVSVPPLSHDDLCKLKQIFDRSIMTWHGQDLYISWWLEAKIAEAKQLKE